MFQEEEGNYRVIFHEVGEVFAGLPSDTSLSARSLRKVGPMEGNPETKNETGASREAAGSVE
jgi:hypothetical protein